MAATPITVYDYSECKGHAITCAVEVVSGGAGAADTVTIPAGMPYLDLTKAHPILNVLWLDISTNDASANDAEGNADDEIARGTAPTAAGDFDIESQSTFKVYHTNNINGLVIFTYLAGGAKAT